MELELIRRTQPFMVFLTIHFLLIVFATMFLIGVDMDDYEGWGIYFIILFTTFPVLFFFFKKNEDKEKYSKFTPIGTLALENERVVINGEMPFKLSEMTFIKFYFVQISPETKWVELSFTAFEKGNRLGFKLPEEDFSTLRKQMELWKSAGVSVDEIHKKHTKK